MKVIVVFLGAILLVIIALICASCSESIEAASTQAGGEVNVDGIKIKCVGHFKDSQAYDGKRKVFRIVDTKTGQEFIGMTGVGISEVGTHKLGKTTVKDDR